MLLQTANLLRINLIALVLVFSTVAVANDKEEKLYGLYLLSASSADVKLGAKSVHADPGSSQIITDLVAERLLADITGANQLDVDTQAWLAKALGSSQSTRYLQTLETVKSATKSRKLRRYLKQSVKQLTASTKTSYLPGDLPLNQMENSLLSAQYNDATKRTINRNTPLLSGEPLSSLLNRLGLPDSANTAAGQVAIRGAGGWAPSKVVVQQMLLIYNGIGEVQLARSQAQGSEWVSYFSVNYQGNDENSINTYRQLLSTDNPKSFHTAITTLRKRQPRVPALLDLLAERLYQSHQTTADHVASGLTHVAATLGESMNPRYRYVLQLTKNEAVSRGVRKWSKWAFKRMPNVELPQYQPGDASL